MKSWPLDDRTPGDLVARATVPAFAFELAGRRIVAANQELLAALGRAADEVLGQPCSFICARCPTVRGVVPPCALLNHDGGAHRTLMLRAGDGTLVPMGAGAIRLADHAVFLALGSAERVDTSAPDVDVHALGGFMATRSSGEPVEPRRPQTVTVLKRLLCQRGRIVSDADLIAALWPTSAPARPRASLRALISDLRRALDPEGDRGGATLIARSAPGYVIPLSAAVRVDFEAFAVAAAAALDAAAEGRLEEAQQRAAEALPLYTGDLFAPDEPAPWFLPLRRRLHRQWVDVLLLNAGLLARRGDLAGAVREAERAAEADYLNEETHRLLLLLTARHAGVAAAGTYFVQLFREFRTRFGVAPSRKTAELMRRLDNGEAIDALEREILSFAS